MTASILVRKIWPLMAVLSMAVFAACAPKPSEDASSSSAAEDPAAVHAPADDVAGRDSAAALEAAMAASPSAVDLAVQSAAASAQAGATPEPAPQHTAEPAKPAHAAH